MYRGWGGRDRDTGEVREREGETEAEKRDSRDIDGEITGGGG